MILYTATPSEIVVFGVPLTAAPQLVSETSIFGFSEFVAALALMVIVFSATDVRYRFRVSIAPFPLLNASFLVVPLLGIGTLLNDLWFSESWYGLPFGVSEAFIEGIFAAVFLGTFLLWQWIAFVRPPTFSKWNCVSYVRKVHLILAQGSKVELEILADELQRSAKQLVYCARQHQRAFSPSLRGSALSNSKTELRASKCADQVLELMADGALCREIVAQSPRTAIRFMDQACKQKKLSILLGDFASQITTAAILDRKSLLYRESMYATDLVGRMRDFTAVMYGNFELVEGLSGARSSLDVDWSTEQKMNGDAFEVYCRITLETYKDYISGDHMSTHSYQLSRAMSTIKNAGMGLSWISGRAYDSEVEDKLKKFGAATDFVTSLLNFIGTQPKFDLRRLLVRGKSRSLMNADVFDQLAKLMLELIADAATVRDVEYHWAVQHNKVWVVLSSFQENWPHRVLKYRLFRLLFDKIKSMDKRPNFMDTRYLGFLLNVLGISTEYSDYGDKYTRRCHRLLISWVQRNFMSIHEFDPRVAANVQNGSLTFDAAQMELVRTRSAWLGGEQPKQILALTAMSKPARKRRNIETLSRATEKP
jgi:hypothetical protein